MYRTIILFFLIYLPNVFHVFSCSGLVSWTMVLLPFSLPLLAPPLRTFMDMLAVVVGVYDLLLLLTLVDESVSTGETGAFSAPLYIFGCIQSGVTENSRLAWLSVHQE